MFKSCYWGTAFTASKFFLFKPFFSETGSKYGIDVVAPPNFSSFNKLFRFNKRAVRIFDKQPLK